MLTDQDYIQKTLQLATRGVGFVSPNPLVGAVIVKDGKIIGEGYHQKSGENHAEVNAIANATEDVAGATLYCNLEPCCHTKKRTPPCTELIIAKKLKKVVIANLDPNPLVSGKGIEKLKNAGIETTSGVLEKEGRKLNEIFFKYISTGIPFIHLKMAQTLDGKLATSTGDSKWITDEKARAQGHQLRLKYDGVLVGRKTLNKDNPYLNIRMGVDAGDKIPFRVILGNPSKMKLKSHVFTDEYPEKTIVVTGNKVWKTIENKRKVFFKDKGIEVITVNETAKGLDLREVLMNLGFLGITSILVEGGEKIITSFINQNIYDKITVFIAPKIFGSIKMASDAIEFRDISIKNLSDQMVFEAYPKEASCSQAL
ncbi:MAG: bifunctional diaminohydroxyphosphoribosylaminopyrimidine deaminase/5-amino-6-(5-phosphoribosylamino)uracil reductase RibD [Epsilonproteobacteria bacterium]|nr:MAG: bifunctional diaminohydroxyphosphoribosylaminopyrimidine deaminase/5-amino-6-(5-phosphoribosylamino)uracil reductase RibD [Campylobacterota bacterium]